MIAEFYKDCEIFITGGSGVVGKAAIEKLLRSCDVKKIYILLRCKKNDSVEQRLEKIKSAKIFRVLKTQKPNEINKLVAIPGDAVLPNLGITPHYAKMMENVSIIFHCAATVRFNESLKMAMNVNVGGTLKSLKFAETLRYLKIYVHVSTFFSNPYLEHVESKMYSSPMDWRLCLQMMEDETKEELFDTLTRKIIVGFPNTYCFTKNLAESVVSDYSVRLPVTIFRPSIVISAVSAPEPGFPPSLTGAMGIFVMAGVGLLKVAHISKEVYLDMTPLDVATIGILTSGYLAVKKYQTGKVAEVLVTLASSHKFMPYSLLEFTNMVLENGILHRVAFEKNFLIPGVYFTSNKCVYNILCFTHQILPALIVDGLLTLFGRKPMLMSLVRKQYISLEIMKPFMFNNYTSDIFDKMPEYLEITNGTEFDFRDALEFCSDKDKLIKNCTIMTEKIREVLLKEDPSTLPRARKIIKIKIILYNIIRCYLVYYLVRRCYHILLE